MKCYLSNAYAVCKLIALTVGGLMATKKQQAEQLREVKKAKEAEKLAKGLAGMKPEVRNRVEKQLTAAAKRKVEEKAKPKPVQVSEESKQRLAEWQAREAMQDEQIKNWVGEIATVRRKFFDATKQIRAERYEALSGAYRIYGNAEDVDFGDMFYRELREMLTKTGAKVQSNTTDAALVIRYILGETVSIANVHKYGSTLRYARDCGVKVEDFIEWVTKMTITAAVAAQKAGVDAKQERKDLMNRARLVILRYFELREVMPFAKVPMLAVHAEKYLSRGSNLCLMVGTGVRRMDRESDYADLLVSAILPPNIDLDRLIVDRYARAIVGSVGHYEEEIDKKSDEVWAAELYDELWQAELEQAEKSSQYWADRMQAGRYESQSEFLKAKKAAKSSAKSSKSTSAKSK